MNERTMPMSRTPSRCYPERPSRHLGRLLKAVLSASLLALTTIALAAPSGEARGPLLVTFSF